MGIVIRTYLLALIAAIAIRRFLFTRGDWTSQSRARSPLTCDLGRDGICGVALLRLKRS